MAREAMSRDRLLKAPLAGKGETAGAGRGEGGKAMPSSISLLSVA